MIKSADFIIITRFLSTSPARGTTDPSKVLLGDLDISIHVPREGDDQAPTLPRTTASYFYPRPPRGGRRDKTAQFVCRYFQFLSTSPARGTTA